MHCAQAFNALGSDCDVVAHEKKITHPKDGMTKKVAQTIARTEGEGAVEKKELCVHVKNTHRHTFKRLPQRHSLQEANMKRENCRESRSFGRCFALYAP